VRKGVGSGVFSLCRSRPIDLIPFLFRIWGWGTLPGGGRRYRLFYSTPRRGHNKSAQGRASRRQPQSDALGTVSIQHGSPERAKQIGSSHTHRSLDAARLVSPLQGWCSPSFITQGGATRLRRSALPWAAMWLPLRGENLWITRSGSPRGHSVIVDFVITPRSQTGTESGIRENTNSR
jgi:hypothetical protein